MSLFSYRQNLIFSWRGTNRSHIYWVCDQVLHKQGFTAMGDSYVFVHCGGLYGGVCNGQEISDFGSWGLYTTSLVGQLIYIFVFTYMQR